MKILHASVAAVPAEGIAKSPSVEGQGHLRFYGNVIQRDVLYKEKHEESE